MQAFAVLVLRIRLAALRPHLLLVRNKDTDRWLVSARLGLPTLSAKPGCGPVSVQLSPTTAPLALQASQALQLEHSRQVPPA